MPSPRVARALAPIWPAGDNFYRHRAGVRAKEDLSYGDAGDPKQRLDLFLPSDPAPAPSVAFIHGGMWKVRDRRFLRGLLGIYSNVGVALALRGIATAVLSYRQVPNDIRVSFSDLARALSWLRAHGAEHGLAPTPPVVMGHSSGAHLAAWLASSEREAGPVAGLLALGGFYDVPRFVAALPRGARRLTERLFAGDAALMEEASPERHVGSGAPPMLIGVSAHEPPMLRTEQVEFLAACGRAGARAEGFEVADTGHMGLVLQMGRTKDALSDRIADRVKAWTR